MLYKNASMNYLIDFSNELVRFMLSFYVAYAFLEVTKKNKFIPGKSRSVQ